MMIDFTHVRKGRVFHSRTGRKYKVQERDEKGFTISRESGGKPQRITWDMCAKVALRLNDGPLKYQANASKGGISYTVAIEIGVLFALKGTYRKVIVCDDVTRTITMRGVDDVN